MAYNNRLYVPLHLSGGTTSQVFTGPGTLHAIVVNTTTNTAMGVYDSVAALTGTLAVLKASIAENTYEYDVVCANGLYLTLGAAGDYTVVWTKG